MSKYIHGGKGLEEQICLLVQDLEGREKEHGDVSGPPVKTLDWTEVCAWLESMGVPEHALDIHRNSQRSGQWYEDLCQECSSTDQAIELLEIELQIPRKLASRVTMNLLQRNSEPVAIREPRTPLLASREIISIIKQMNTVGFGRYHGADIFASKFGKNKGIDVLLRNITNTDNETCLSCLTALLLLCNALENKDSETSHEEAQQRFEIRKMIIKAGGIRIFLNALLRNDPAVQVEALRLLKNLTSFPDYWTTSNGDSMNVYYKNATQELVDGGVKMLLQTMMSCDWQSVKIYCIQVLQNALIHDIIDFERDCKIRVDGSFYIPSGMRKRLRELPLSQGLQSSPQVIRASYEPHIRKRIVEEGGISLLCETIAMPSVHGTIKISNIMARQLPRVDRMGDSDPFCMIFVESNQARTATINDNCNPQWLEDFVFELEDVGSSILVILVFDEDENDVYTFMAMTAIPLSEIVRQAREAEDKQVFSSFRFGKETTTEILNAFRKDVHPKPLRVRNTVLSDAWVELKERNFKKPSLTGGLGFLHLTIELETSYRHDAESIQVRACALGALHLLCAEAECRRLCVAQKHVVHHTVKLMKSWNEDAQMNAARFLGDLTSDDGNISSVVLLGGIEALVQSIDFSSPEIKSQGAQSLALLAFSHDIRDKLLHLDGHIGASAKDIVAVFEDLLKDAATMEDCATSAITCLINACLEDIRFRERIVKSNVVKEVLTGVARYGGNFRAEACCLLALLSEAVDNRLPLSRIVARNGEESIGVVSACTLALCSADCVTDARNLTAAEDARVAASNALCFMSEYGGLEEVIKALRHGSDVVIGQAAKTLGKIATMQSDRMAIIRTGVIPDLAEIIISSSSSEARINAAAALANLSEAMELEPSSEVKARVSAICCMIPHLGVSAIDPVINVLLRSSDEGQRCAAAWTLSTWCVVEALAKKIWEEGCEGLIDILYGKVEANPDGVYFCVRLLTRTCHFERLRADVGGCRFIHDGRERSALEALRYTLGVSPEPSVVEDAAKILQTLSHHGGLEVLTDIVLAEEGDEARLKVCASSLQPLCAREEGRLKVAERAGLDVMDVSMWLSKYILTNR